MYKQKLNPIKTSTWNWRLIRYYETYNASYHDFVDRAVSLTKKLMNPRFLVVQMESSLRKFTVATMTRLINCYEISVSQITTDMFPLSYLKPGLFLIHGSSQGLSQE